MDQNLPWVLLLMLLLPAFSQTNDPVTRNENTAFYTIPQTLASADSGDSIPADIILLQPEIIMLHQPRDAKVFYPKDAAKKRQQGVVTVRFVVTELGSVSEVQILRSSNVRSLDQTAIEAVNSLQFNPTVKGGKPVRIKMMKTFIFMLTNTGCNPPPPEGPAIK